MEKSIIIAGFGGQGIILTGEIIARAGMKQNKKVSLVPSYGPEMRGGTANCTVIIKDGEIFSPVVTNPDIQIMMNQPSMDRFEPRTAESGVILYNSSLCSPVNNRTDVTYHKIPATEIATSLGVVKVANMAVLGALCAKTELFPPEIITDEILPEILTGKKASLLDKNREAFQKGYDL